MDPIITNRWGEAETHRLDSSEHVVWYGAEGCAYTHHPHVVALGTRLFATFSSGEAHEDDVGQRVMFTQSDDAGATWSEPRCIAEPPQGRYAPCVLTPTGFHLYHPPDKDLPLLVAYFGRFEYAVDGLENGHRGQKGKANHANTVWMAMVSEDLGTTWSEPMPLLERFVANLGPRPLASGRLLAAGSVVYPHTDDPAGLTGWTWRALPELFADHVDDSQGFKVCLGRDRRRFGYCEGSFFQTDDGTVRMMLRTNRDRLAVTESRDDGESWSEVRPTEFSDNESRHQFGRLPDGRFFALSTPRPDNRHERTPLVLALSEDGVVFDRHFVLGDAPDVGPRLPGLHKHGRYGYPHLAIAGETVVVLYSVAKEDLACCRFPLAALGD